MNTHIWIAPLKGKGGSSGGLSGLLPGRRGRWTFPILYLCLLSWFSVRVFFFFFFFAISKITLHDLLDANTVDLWLCWPLPCCLGPRGAFPLLVYPERFRSCSAKKGSLVLPAHGLTTCVAPALGPHALVGAWPHISDRPWSFGLPGPRHSWSLAFNRFPETPKEIPIAMCLIAQPLPAAQLCP